jgi:bis(5'-nucleosyl)-tetraphosphatase (symmetrical)
MTTFAIGDVQGCDNSLGRLLEKINFRKKKDTLWFVGDLVNRGPDSLKVLRRVRRLGKKARCVLGNHDLHLLALAAGARKLRPHDTLYDVLAARDADELIDWLRRRPLMHYEPYDDRALVHAGIPPGWSIKKALKHAARAEERISGQFWRAALRKMYGTSPRQWSKRLTPNQKFRYTINSLTRMRFCTYDGSLNLRYTGPPGSQPLDLVPWFRVPDRVAADTHIVFGHWAALGVYQRKNLTGLDSGCVWGRSLTAIALDGRRTRNSRTRVKCRL